MISIVIFFRGRVILAIICFITIFTLWSINMDISFIYNLSFSFLFVWHWNWDSSHDWDSLYNRCWYRNSLSHRYSSYNRSLNVMNISLFINFLQNWLSNKCSSWLSNSLNSLSDHSSNRFYNGGSLCSSIRKSVKS